MSRTIGEFELLLLFAVLRLGSGAWGVAIRQEIEQRAGRSVSAGAVYTSLDRLETKGLVASRVGETTPARGGRRRKYYEVTPAGAEALRRSYEEIRSMAEGVAGRLSALAAKAEGGA